jgi:hypothetical protein
MQKSREWLSRGCLPALMCLFGANTAHAYRPFDGTDGDVAELGEFELELGPAHVLREGGRNFLLTPTVFNLGILPRTELVVDIVGEAPFHPLPSPIIGQRGEGKYQLRDTDVFLKFLLRKGTLQDETGLSIAFEGGPLIPEIYGEKGYGASGNLIFSGRWGWFTAHLNNELELARGTGDPVWGNSLIFEFGVSERFRPVTEVVFERDIKGKTNLYSALGGFIWSVVEDFDIDAAVVVATEDGEQAFEGRLGLTWAFAVYEPREVSPESQEKNADEHRVEDEDQGQSDEEAAASTKQHARR